MTICHLAASGMASHASGAEDTFGNGSPARVIAHGHVMPLAWTMYPTNANMATRPCFTSDSRRKPIVDSFDVPQNSAPARFSGSKYLTAGFSFCASDWRSAFVSEMVVDDARPTGAGAKAAAEPKMAERRASFIIVVGVCCIQENFGLALFFFPAASRDTA